jgi:menaquinone C8-methyltransferase
MDPARLASAFLDVPGLYLHFPFCRSLCPFCPYNRVAYEQPLARDYHAALQQEIALVVRAFDREFHSLYVGGGTPTISLDALEAAVAGLRVHGERAIEILPGHATPATLARLRAMGFTFVSLGAQSFDDEVLRHLGRPNTARQNRAAIRNAVGRFECVDVDLVFDVAFRDAATFLHDVETCVSMGVDQISTYPLMRFGYTPFGKVPHARRAEHELLGRAEELAARHGYERRSVWTLNRRGAPTLSSITREFYLGLGAGSASYTGREFWVNHFSVPRYLESVARGGLPVARAMRLPTPVSAAYYLFWRGYASRLDLRRVEELFGTPVGAVTRAALRLLGGAGLVERDGEEVHLSPRGRDVYHDLERWTTYSFIEPLWAEMMAEHGDAGPAHGGGRGRGGLLWGLTERALRA